MIAHLTDHIDNFPSAANQTRCFAHTLSKAAKAIIKQFDIPTVKKGEDLDEATEALAELAKGLYLEECAEVREENDDENEPLNPWEDFRDGMTDEQRRALDSSVQPVQSMLVKVC